MNGPTLNEIAKALGSEVRNGEVRAPGPGHSAKDRSLTVVLSDEKHDGYVVKSFGGDDWQKCRNYVREKLGLAPFKPNSAKAKVTTARTITYDYRDPVSGEVLYRKTRHEYSEGVKDFYFEKPSRNGGPAFLYGGQHLVNLTEGQPVWIVEGEKKVDRLRELGEIAVSGDTGHGSKWLPEHAELLRGLPIILWPDSDEPGEGYIANAAAAILAVNPCADLRVVRPFGEPNGAKGRDVCDWTGNAEDLAELAAGALPYAPLSEAPPSYGEPARLPAPNPITVLSYDEMVGLPSTDWLIDGLVPRRSKSVLFGQSDSFKSFIAVDMACSVSTGRSYHGKPVKRCKVIYVANEGAIGVGRKRIPAWMACYDIPPDGRRNIFMVKAETILPNEASRANLIKAIRTIVEPGEDFLLIIDVLRGTMTGSESDDEAAHAWTRAAEILVDEGTTLLTDTHSPYSTDDRIRGSSHLWGSFDTRLQAEGDKEKMTAVLKVNRHKDHDSTGQWGFKLDVQDILEHPGETSLVPRLDDEVKAAPHVKKNGGTLTEIITRQYLETYDRLANGGEKSHGLNFKPVAKVSVDAIRDNLKSRGILDKNSTRRGGLTDAARAALCKAKAGLINSGKLVENDDLIWRP